MSSSAEPLIAKESDVEPTSELSDERLDAPPYLEPLTADSIAARELTRAFKSSSFAKFSRLSWNNGVLVRRILLLYCALLLIVEVSYVQQPVLKLKAQEDCTRNVYADAANAWYSYYHNVKKGLCQDDPITNSSASSCAGTGSLNMQTYAKPEYPWGISLVSYLSTLWLPFIDGSKLLASDLSAPEGLCESEGTCMPIPENVGCGIGNSSEVIRRPFRKFELEEHTKVSVLGNLNLSIPPATKRHCWEFGHSLLYCIFACFVLELWRAVFPKSRKPFREALRRGIVGVLLLLPVLQTVDLLLPSLPAARMFARDRFVEHCFTQEIQGVPLSPSCAVLTSNPMGTKLLQDYPIEILSWWRGYYFSKVVELSMDNFLFTTLSLLSALYFWFLGTAFWSRRRGEKAKAQYLNGTHKDNYEMQ